MIDDHERCYRAVKSRDARFDGVFYTGVRTTGIYCRPSCPAQNAAPAQRAVLRQRGGGPGCRLPRLPPLPPRHHAGLAGVERPCRRRGPRHAPHRRRRGGARGRRRPRVTTRIQHPSRQPHGHRRAWCRASCAGSQPPGSVGSRAHRDHRHGHGRHRLRVGVRVHPPVQRLDPARVRDVSHRDERPPQDPAEWAAHAQAGRSSAVRPGRSADVPRRPRDRRRGARR